MSTIGPSNVPSPVTPLSISATTTSTAQLEALEQYYQANTGVASLEQVIQIIEHLQSTQTAAPQTSTTPDPSAELTQSVLTGLLSMIGSLQGVAATVSLQSPALTAMTEQLSALQAGLQQTPPQGLSDEQLSSLTTDLQSLDVDNQRLPLNEQSKYWAQQGSLFETLGTQITSLANLSQLGTTNQSVIEACQTLNTMSQSGVAPPNPSQLATVIDSIMQFLPQVGTDTAAGVQGIPQTVTSLFQGVQFNAYQSSSTQATNYSLAQLVAYAQIGQWASSYIAGHPGATSAQLQGYLQQQSSTYLASNTTNNADLNSVKAALLSALDNSSFPQTLQNIGIQPDATGALQGSSATNPVAQVISSLGIIGISQPPATAVDPQVTAAQNTMAYINQQLAPYEAQIVQSDGQTSPTLPSSVLQNVVPAINQLLHIYNGTDAAAAKVADSYINVVNGLSGVANNLYVTRGGQQYTLVQLAQTYDIVNQAMQYGATNSPVTQQGLQGYLMQYVVTQMPNDDAQLNLYEIQLVDPSIPSDFTNLPLQMWTIQNGNVNLPQNTAAIFQPPNTLSLGGTQPKEVFNSQPLLEVSFPATNIQATTTESSPQWVSQLAPYQDSLTALSQSVYNAQISSAVQKALVDQQIAGPPPTPPPIISTAPTDPKATATTTQMLNNVVNLIQSLYALPGGSAQNPAIALAKALVASVTQLLQSIKPDTTPTQTPLMASMLQQLQSMQSQLNQNPPQMPSTSSLNSLVSNLQTTSTDVSTNCSTLVQSNFLLGIEALSQNVGTQLTSLNAGTQLQQIGSTLSAMGQRPLSVSPAPAQLTTIMNNLLGLLPQITSYGSAGVLQQTQDLFQNLQFNAYQPNGSPQATNYSLAQTLAYAQIAQWSSSYLKANPTATSAQLQANLQQQSSAYLSSASSLPFVSQIQSALQSDLNPTNYAATLGILNLSTSSGDIISFTNPQADPVAQTLSNLALVQVSQASTTVQDPQVVLAQNSISYINSQLSPYILATGGTATSLSASVLNNIAPALANLVSLDRGTDSVAANAASNYLTNTHLQFSNALQTNSPPSNLMQLAAYIELANQADLYAKTNPTMTLSGLQGALTTYVNALPSTDPSNINAFEKNLVGTQGGVSSLLISGQNGIGQVMNGQWKGDVNDTTNVFNSLMQFGTVDITTNSADVPNNLIDTFNLSGNQISLNTSNTAQAVFHSSGLQPLTNPSPIMSSSAMAAMASYAPQMSSVVQQLTSVQNTAAVQENVIVPNNESLQDMFKNIILDHYMPGQESLLQNQSNQLNWTNWLGSQYTSLVSATSSFSSSNTVLNFAEKLSSPIGSSITAQTQISYQNDSYADLFNDTHSFDYLAEPQFGLTMSPNVGNVAYQGNAQVAQQALATEKAYVTQGVDDSQKAIAQIQTILNDLQPPGTDKTAAFLNNPALASQIQTIRTTLKNQLNELQSTVTNLNNLLTTLNTIQIIPAPANVQLNFTDPDTGKPAVAPSVATGWNSSTQFCIETTPAQGVTSQNTAITSTLSGQEGALVNGGGNVSSLSQIAQDINTTSQQTTSQSQTQQMELQLSMTEIQQEWSVVSSALQILNQIYMGFARGISK